MADTRQQGCIKGNTAAARQGREYLVCRHVTTAQILGAGMQCQAAQQSQCKLLNRTDQACIDGMADHENPGQAHTQTTQPNHPVCFQGVDQPGFKGKSTGWWLRDMRRRVICRHLRSRLRLWHRFLRDLRNLSRCITALKGRKLLPKRLYFTTQLLNTGGLPVTLAIRQKAQQRTDRHQQGRAGHENNKDEFQTTIPCLLKKSGLNPARLRHQAIHHGNRNIPENCF